MLNNKKAAIFDLDGTLVDSMWMWEQIDVEYLERFQISEIPVKLKQEIEGRSFTETAVYFKEMFRLPDSVEKIKADWNKMAYEKYTKEVPLKPGASAFIEYAWKNGIKLGIATSNSRELVTAVIEAHHLEQAFHSVLTSCEAKAGKPAPDIYLLSAERLGVKPSECIVFEDIPMGILAGKRAGMEVCAVEDQFSAPRREEKKKLADYYITSYEEILSGSYERMQGWRKL